MNVKDFYKYIEEPDLLNASTVAELQELLKAYPYFQTAHILYLKSLYNQNNFKFNYQLKFSSVHVNNRKKLLFYLKGKTPSSVYRSEIKDKDVQSSQSDLNASDFSKDGLQVQSNVHDLVSSNAPVESGEDASVSEEQKEEIAFEMESEIAEKIEREPIITQSEIAGQSTEASINDDLLKFEQSELPINEDVSVVFEKEPIALIEELKPEVQPEIEPEVKLDVASVVIEDLEDKATDDTFEKPKAETENSKKESVKEDELAELELEPEAKEEPISDCPQESQEPPATLSPQEILQRRIDEIKKAKQEHTSGLNELVNKASNQPFNSVPKPELEKLIEPFIDPSIENGPDNGLEQTEIQSIVNESEQPKEDEDVKAVQEGVSVSEDDSLLDDEDNTLLTASTTNSPVSETDILGSELSDLIQIAAPAEYFLEDLSSESEIKLESKFSKRRKKTNSDSKQSFAYWVKHLQHKKDKETQVNTKGQVKSKGKVKSKKTPEKVISKLDEKSSLIDSFLADNKPKAIKPKPQVTNALKDRKSAKEETDEAFMTETLAQIYIKQAYYDKAIAAYVKLSLKYPKKNTYFATQIKKVKTLQLNS